MTAQRQSLFGAGAFTWVAGLVAILVVLRLIALMTTPLNLGPDEAQYWSWSLTPAFGYFSKPPFIAWLIGATTAVCGDGEACIRASAPLLHGATTIVLFFAGRALYDERTGLWSAVTFALMPGTSFSSLLITTDVPLLFFWSVGLLALAELRRAPNAIWAAVLGAAIGFGMLSKYAMLYFVLGIALAFVSNAKGRALIASRAGLIAGVVALAVFLPNIVWNVLHGFETVSHTASNANWGAAKLFNVGKALEFIGAQFGILGPVAALTIVWGLVRGWRDRDWGSADTLLLSLSVPILLIVTVQAFISRANGNWAAPAFVALSILFAAWAVRRNLFSVLGLNTALNALIGIVLTLTAVSPAVVALLGQENSVKRLKGWDIAGQTIVSASNAAPYTAIMSDDREDMASLYYYTRSRSKPLVMVPRPTARNEYEAAYALEQKDAALVLFVTKREDVSDVLTTFAKAERVGSFTTRLDSKRTRTFSLFALTGPFVAPNESSTSNRPSTDD